MFVLSSWRWLSGMLSVAIGIVALFFPSSVLAAPPPPERAVPGRELVFPRDHGAHLGFTTEWWYLTGHLGDGDVFETASAERPQRRYGFQLTFFRRVAQGGGREKLPGVVEGEELYLAHAAVTDISNQRFYTGVYSGPANLGLGHISDRDLRLRLLDWSLERIADTMVVHFSVTPAGETEPISVRLVTPLPEPLRHGDRGWSQKGPDPKSASYYYSLVGLKPRGVIVRGDEERAVQGIAWFDHEFMSDVMDDQVLGWDWFSLQAPDGGALMVFRVRRKGAADYLSGTLRSGGGLRVLSGGDIGLKPTREWQSQGSGASYPIGWELRIAGIETPIVLQSMLEDQEHRSSGTSSAPAYYEGAVKSSDGRWLGYLEMTGYAKPIGGSL